MNIGIPIIYKLADLSEYKIIYVSTHHFIGVFGPREVAHLRASVHTLQRLTGQCVPETDTPESIYRIFIQSASWKSTNKIVNTQNNSRRNSLNQFSISLFK